MVQLTDDCFAFGGDLVALNTALASLRASIDSLAKVETVSLDQSYGRVLSNDVIAQVSLPPGDNSAVDGFAVCHAELNRDRPTILPIFNRVAAGNTNTTVHKKQTATQILTGALMPQGADTVFMLEDAKLGSCEEDGQLTVTLPPGLKKGANRRLAGEDFLQGKTVLSAGTRLRPQDVALAAAAGASTLEVCCPLKVALISTGNEVQDPSQSLVHGQIYDSNRFSLLGLLRSWGCRVTDMGIARDDPNELIKMFNTAAKAHDLILTSGGVSTGEEDHVKLALDKVGQVLFWRLAVKPGRPVALGKIGNALFAGLPGNPAATFVTAAFVVKPLIRHLLGQTIEILKFPVPLGFSAKKKKGRREWLRVRIESQSDGSLVAHKFPVDGAGILSGLTWAHGLLEIPEDKTHMDIGEIANFIPFSEVQA